MSSRTAAKNETTTRNEDVGEFTTFTDDDVFVMDADGGNVRQLTHEKDGSSSSQPAWSPDGQRIAYVRGPSIASAVVSSTPLAFGELVVVDAAGGESTRLTRGEPDAAPAWSPDGRRARWRLRLRGRRTGRGSHSHAVRRALHSPERQRSSSSIAMDWTNHSCSSTSSTPKRPTGSAGARTGGALRLRQESWTARSLRRFRFPPDTYVV